MGTAHASTSCLYKDHAEAWNPPNTSWSDRSKAGSSQRSCESACPSASFVLGSKPQRPLSKGTTGSSSDLLASASVSRPRVCLGNPWAPNCWISFQVSLVKLLTKPLCLGWSQVAALSQRCLGAFASTWPPFWPTFWQAMARSWRETLFRKHWSSYGPREHLSHLGSQKDSWQGSRPSQGNPSLASSDTIHPSFTPFSDFSPLNWYLLM